MVAAWGTAIRIGQVSGPAVVASLLAVGNTHLVLWDAAALFAAMLIFVTLVRPYIDRDPDSDRHHEQWAASIVAAVDMLDIEAHQMPHSGEAHRRSSWPV